jgi:fatty acid desaturase
MLYTLVVIVVVIVLVVVVAWPSYDLEGGTDNNFQNNALSRSLCSRSGLLFPFLFLE